MTTLTLPPEEYATVRRVLEALYAAHPCGLVLEDGRIGCVCDQVAVERGRSS